MTAIARARLREMRCTVVMQRRIGVCCVAGMLRGDRRVRLGPSRLPGAGDRPRLGGRMRDRAG
ncbi:hypothetical protein, partial [Burkholderia sp. Ap-962]|uniref:hypothetical protein n=1 Tax=Burkholderia sp. Ap-962 TaxID=2608333 RepID=UPI00196246DC